MYFVDQLRDARGLTAGAGQALVSRSNARRVPVPVVAAEKPASQGENCRSQRSVHEGDSCHGHDWACLSAGGSARQCSWVRRIWAT